MTNYVQLRLKPTEAEGKTVTFHPQKGTNAQTDVVALGLGPAGLAALDPAELLDASVILLDPPTELPVLQAGQGSHLHVAARPVVRVAVCGDYPEHTNRSVARQMDHTPLLGNVQRAERLRRPEVHPHLAIGLQPTQPSPTQRPDQLQVLQPAVPTVEADALGAQAALLGRTQLLSEQVVLAEAVVRFVVDPIVAGDVAGAAGPQKGQPGGASCDGSGRARPV